MWLMINRLLVTRLFETTASAEAVTVSEYAESHHICIIIMTLIRVNRICRIMLPLEYEFSRELLLLYTGKQKQFGSRMNLAGLRNDRLCFHF
jgi:hypothetical protein